MYYSKEEYKALSYNQRAELHKKRKYRSHKPAEKKVRSKRGGAIEDMAKQVYALVYVMKSASEAPGTATSSTNSKNSALTRHIIPRE